MKFSPLLSITIPAYNRPKWLQRALLSITTDNGELCQDIEIIVTDDSSNSACGEITQQILENWPGKWQYKANNPRLGMAQNWNHGIELASGDYVLILHDDDFLLPGSIESILQVIQETKQQYSVLLFGVNVVNEREKVLKKQSFKNRQYLSKKSALINLLSNSSFVRFPAIVMQRIVFEEVGYFNPQWGEPTDIEMWIRLFSRYGVCCIPVITCAYTVHSQALTMGVFNENTVNTLVGFFHRVDELNLLSLSELKQCQAMFFHQFILAGAFRYLRRGKLLEFHQIMDLFNLPNIQPLSCPLRWLLIRFFLEIVDRYYHLL
ncbi:MAG TPA: glycosyl transferase [Cyanothece sp. UBA12306]|nr:glycosyl transferase [Cyanothece sp. UBA12306]